MREVGAREKQLMPSAKDVMAEWRDQGLTRYGEQDRKCGSAWGSRCQEGMVTCLCVSCGDRQNEFIPVSHHGWHQHEEKENQALKHWHPGTGADSIIPVTVDVSFMQRWRAQTLSQFAKMKMHGNITQKTRDTNILWGHGQEQEHVHYSWSRLWFVLN